MKKVKIIFKGGAVIEFDAEMFDVVNDGDKITGCEWIVGDRYNVFPEYLDFNEIAGIFITVVNDNGTR